MNRLLSSPMVASSTKSTDSSASPRMPSAASTFSANRCHRGAVDRMRRLLVGDEHLDVALVRGGAGAST